MEHLRSMSNSNLEMSGGKKQLIGSGIKFSICIPNYNYAHYIGETIQSVLDQSYQNFEIIVADNASEDNSTEVVRSFCDKRVRILVNKLNIGFSPNLDKATQDAVGDYIILLSSDDIMKPGALEEYAEIINKHNGDINDLVIMSGCYVVDSEGKTLGEKKPMTGDVISFLMREGNDVINYRECKYEGLYILQGLLVGRFQPAGQFLTTCFSKSLYEKVEGYNSVLSVWPDAHFSHKILFENPKVIFLNRKLFGYRVHDQNNLAAVEQMKDIKSLVDGYHLTLLYPERLLRRLGLEQKNLRKAFIKNICLSPSLFSLFRGNFAKPFAHLMFAFASYPCTALRIWQGYLIFCMLPFAPLLRVLTLGRKLRK